MGGFMEWIQEHPAIAWGFGIVAVLLLAAEFIKNKNQTGAASSGLSNTSGLATDSSGNPVAYVPTTTSFGTQTDYTASPQNSPGATVTTGDIPTVAPGGTLTYSPSTSTTTSPTSTYAPAPTTTTTGLSGSDTAQLVSSLGATQAQLTPNVTNSNNTNSNNPVTSTTGPTTTTTTTGPTTTTTKTQVSGRHNTVISPASSGIPPVHTVVQAKHPAPSHHVSGTPNQPPGIPITAPHPTNPNGLPPVRSTPVHHPVTTHVTTIPTPVAHVTTIPTPVAHVPAVTTRALHVPAATHPPAPPTVVKKKAKGA